MKAPDRSSTMTPRVGRPAGGPKPVSVSGPFVCGWSAVGGCAVVRVAGRVDNATALTFENELRHVITTKRPTLVVDLRRVTSMDAAGIRALATGHALALEHGGWLRLSGAKEWLTDLMRATRLDVRIQHFPTLAEALPRYRPAAVGPTRTY